MSSTANYRNRFRRVVEYIDAHLDEDLQSEQLSRVASFSRFHFHRQFCALLGLSVHRYVTLLRLRRASYQLAFREDKPIIDIALECGYENPESFSRAFRKNIGQTPSEFRADPQWDTWYEVFDPLTELRISHMIHEYQPNPVCTIDFPETSVATLEHHGDPALIGDSIRRFIEWRKQNALPPRVSATFNIFYDDPTTTPPADYRLDICAVTQRDVAPNAAGVVQKSIPAGRCAVLRHKGSDDTLGAALDWLYREWLPASGEEPRDYPPYLQRISFFPDVPEHEAVVDIFIPLV